MARPKSNAAPIAPSAPSSSPQRPPESPSGTLPPKSQLIPLREAVRLLGVHENTARRWSSGSDAILKCYRVGQTGQRRWLRTDILAMANGETEEISSKGESLNQAFKRYKRFCKEEGVAALSKLKLSQAATASMQ